METKSLDDLRANPKNPRTINKHDYESLVKSIKEFGDLSGIVFNVQTKQLVGGHQRTEAFKRMSGEKKIIINQRFTNADGTPQPNRQGTIAIGYVDYDNEQYSYREVDWPLEREQAANIAANRIQGQFDLDLLAEISYEISQAEDSANLLALTGQTDEEVNKLLSMVTGEPPIDLPDGEKDGFQQVTFTLTDEQAEVVSEALGNTKLKIDPAQTGNPNSNGNALYFVARDYLERLHNGNAINRETNPGPDDN